MTGIGHPIACWDRLPETCVAGGARLLDRFWLRRFTGVFGDICTYPEREPSQGQLSHIAVAGISSWNVSERESYRTVKTLEDARLWFPGLGALKARRPRCETR